MKNIVVEDRANPNVFYESKPHVRGSKTVYSNGTVKDNTKYPTRIERITRALEELKHTGNINIYYSKNDRKPLQLIACKGW